jgi:hypothetical protein
LTAKYCWCSSYISQPLELPCTDAIGLHFSKQKFDKASALAVASASASVSSSYSSIKKRIISKTRTGEQKAGIGQPIWRPKFVSNSQFAYKG